MNQTDSAGTHRPIENQSEVAEQNKPKAQERGSIAIQFAHLAVKNIQDLELTTAEHMRYDLSPLMGSYLQTCKNLVSTFPSLIHSVVEPTLNDLEDKIMIVAAQFYKEAALRDLVERNMPDPILDALNTLIKVNKEIVRNGLAGRDKGARLPSEVFDDQMDLGALSRQFRVGIMGCERVTKRRKIDVPGINGKLQVAHARDVREKNRRSRDHGNHDFQNEMKRYPSRVLRSLPAGTENTKIQGAGLGNAMPGATLRTRRVAQPQPRTR